MGRLACSRGSSLTEYLAVLGLVARVARAGYGVFGDAIVGVTDIESDWVKMQWTTAASEAASAGGGCP